MVSTGYVWAKIINHMEERLTDVVVSTWFDQVEVLELSDSKLVLSAPDEFFAQTLRDRFTKYINAAFKELYDTEVEITVLYGTALEQFRNNNKEPDFMAFNPQFTFSNFVVGSSNRFAHATAKAVAAAPAEAYNPLFIHGPSGLGKTHLLYAIAAEIHKQHPDYNIVYIKGDQFTNELIDAIQKGKNVEFRNKYRNADLFLMDDVQFIAGKASTQEEFFHTFNTLWESKRQIVITADRPPKEMHTLEERLQSRFEWGILADIQPPDYETRMAILKNKAHAVGLDLPNPVCAYIAENITTNIRQIEGTVKKLKAYQDLSMLTMDVPGVARAIKDMYKDKQEALPTPDLIISEVGRFYSLDPATLRSAQRSKNIAEARQIAIYLMRTLINLSLEDIGRNIQRDHATVLYSIDKVQTALNEHNRTIENNIRDITANINSRL